MALECQTLDGVWKCLEDNLNSIKFAQLVTFKPLNRASFEKNDIGISARHGCFTHQRLKAFSLPQDVELLRNAS